jgi:glycosyltransferase involved in cell wall biosynthesis
MKILQIIGSLAPRYGGPSVACPAMCRELLRRGHEVSIYTTDVDGRGHLKPQAPIAGVLTDVPVQMFPGWTFPPEYKFSPALAQALKKNVARFDVAHIYSMFIFSATAGAQACREEGVPYLLHPHGTLDPFLRQRHRARKLLYTMLVERRNFARATALLFNSEEERRLASSAWGLGFCSHDASHRRIEAVVPVGVEADWFHELSAETRQEYRRTFPGTLGKRLVTFFGRLNFKKGLDILVPAFARVAAARPDVHLVLAGPDGEGYGEKVRGWLKDAGLIDRATFTGALQGDQRVAALQESEVFMLTSYSENFGQAVAEAMACGIPVLVSDRVNLWPEVEQAGAGYVVRCEAEAAAEALARLLDDPAQSRRMGRAGKQLAREKFPWSVVGGQMECLYEEILRSSAGGSSPGSSPNKRC